MAAFAIENFEAAVRRCGLRLTPDQTCFELGCGVGRLTAWLAPHFARVIAADISANHLGLATSVLSSRGIDNVTFLHLQAPEALESLPAFDVFRSLIVLQHNPLPIMVLILNTNLILLCPGDIVYFTRPVHWKKFTPLRRLYQGCRNQRGIEMHVLSQRMRSRSFTPAIAECLRYAKMAGQESQPESRTPSWSRRALLYSSPDCSALDAVVFTTGPF